MFGSILRRINAKVPRRFFSESTFDPKHLEVLVCPISKKPLTLDYEKKILINKELAIAFPIIDGIPHLIPEEALTEF